eukprot:579134-Rhodomonas_salina.1
MVQVQSAETRERDQQNNGRARPQIPNSHPFAAADHDITRLCCGVGKACFAGYMHGKRYPAVWHLASMPALRCHSHLPVPPNESTACCVPAPMIRES